MRFASIFRPPRRLASLAVALGVVAVAACAKSAEHSERAAPADAAVAEAVFAGAAPGAPQAMPVAPNPEEAARVDAAAKPHGRQLIYTAELHVSVRDLDAEIHRAEALAQEVGGWVQSLNGPTLVLRVPATKLRECVERIGKWGRILRRDYHSEDVTDQLVDLETRIRVMRQTQEQLFALLARADKVEDALAVRKRLDEITLELEQALARQRLLQESVAFSRLNLAFEREQGTLHQVGQNDPFPWVDRLGVEVTKW